MTPFDLSSEGLQLEVGHRPTADIRQSGLVKFRMNAHNRQLAGKCWLAGWVTLTALSYVPPVAAHHSSSAYFDIERELTLQGTVARFDWRNPHSYLYLDVVGPDGQHRTWRLEGGAVALMRRLGWTNDTLTPGEEISVTVSPSRNVERSSGLLLRVDRDGRETPPITGEQLVARLSGADEHDSPAQARGLAGTWTTLLDLEDSRAFEFANNPSSHALTAAGTMAVESFDERTMHPGLDCIPYTAPVLMVTPDIKQIEVREGAIFFRSEFDGTERTIFLNSQELPEEPTLHGNSLGRWEEGALVIETTGFSPHRMGNAYSLPSGANKRLRERLELSEDGSSLMYEFELSDPEFMAEPLKGRATWAYRPDLEFSMLSCSTENSRLYLED